MKKHKYATGDTVIFEGKQAIVEAFHKKQIVVYLIDEQERHLVYPNKLFSCDDKYEVMVKTAEG